MCKRFFLTTARRPHISACDLVVVDRKSIALQDLQADCDGVVTDREQTPGAWYCCHTAQGHSTLLVFESFQAVEQQLFSFG